MRHQSAHVPRTNGIDCACCTRVEQRHAADLRRGVWGLKVWGGGYGRARAWRTAGSAAAYGRPEV
eukprot:365088-Chlamydomonas_euryale.AAC.1